MTDFEGRATRNAESMATEPYPPVEHKRRRTAEANVRQQAVRSSNPSTPQVEADLDGLTDQLQSVSLAISAAMENEEADVEAEEAGFGSGMEELRKWYQTEVFAVTDAQQQRWEERRWAFLGQLQHALRKPLNHTVFHYKIEQSCDEDDDAPYLAATLAHRAANRAGTMSAFGGLLFVGRSRYNDVVVADETVSRVHCILVRSAGKIGVFDGWSSYGTVALARGGHNKPCHTSTTDNRRPLLFDEGESFLLRVGKNATVLVPGHPPTVAAALPLPALGAVQEPRGGGAAGATQSSQPLTAPSQGPAPSDEGGERMAA